MIDVDDRTGSCELHPCFPAGMSRLTRLQFADFAFWGRGADDVPVHIGVERKTIGDLVSCMTTKRFAGHQLIGLSNVYNHVYIVVEGMYRPEPHTGVLETWKRGGWSPLSHGRRSYLYSSVVNFLCTLQTLCGVGVVRTATDTETVHAVLALYHWWNDKAWDEHRSHVGVYTPLRAHAAIIDPPLVTKVASQLKGVGWERADALGASFASVAALSADGEGELATVPGIGVKLARSIAGQLRGGA